MEENLVKTMFIWRKNMWHQFCLVLELGRNKKRDYKLVVFSQLFKLFHAWYRAIALSNSYSAYLVRLCICPWEMIIMCTQFHFFTVYQYCQLQMSSSIIHNLFIYLFVLPILSIKFWVRGILRPYISGQVVLSFAIYHILEMFKILTMEWQGHI